MGKHADPRTRLTEEERRFIDDVLSHLSREEILKELQDNLQIASHIELATIPIYLYTYYSIQRAEKSGENMRPSDLFADKAGGVIMSVAVEEMLHMSLACNIIYALGGSPNLYGQSPGPYPTGLPYHNPEGPPGPGGPTDTKVLIPLSKFSYDQLWHFLQIEYPEPRGTLPKDRNWNTIGQFYSYIRCLICSGKVYDSDFQAGSKEYQIQPYNYSPNNIDTAHPKSKFDPWGIPPARGRKAGRPRGGSPSAAEAAVFSNAPDSHAGKTELITVSSIDDALDAIDTICDQGEGFDHTRFDDPSHAEESHYYKFLELQAQLERYPNHIETLPKEPKPPAPVEPTVTCSELEEVIVNFPDNPTSMSYTNYYNESPATRVNYRPYSDLINGIYQYMLILTETVFKVRDEGPDGGGQKLFFNVAMHRTMIWVLDKLCQSMRGNDLGNGQALAPTFENIDLGPRQDAYANLMALAEATKDTPYYSDQLEYYIGVLQTVPDVNKYWGGPGDPVPEPYPYQDAPQWPKEIGQQPEGKPLHACMGLNSCAASDRFGIDGPPGGSPNECAGQGYCSTTADHTCHVQNECKNQGGCGLYGTAEELDQPGVNDCKALGSCATPINAERFSTNGPNQGKSVWKRARAVFEARWEKQRLWKEIPGAPKKLGKPPAPFDKLGGPAYLWISDDNDERKNMTACGASGLSGAGGCS